MVDLEPNDPRPIYSIRIADAEETALLRQELDLEPLRSEGTTLYFFAAEGLNDRLRNLGYQPAQGNPYQVFRRVVRIDRRGTEEDLLAAGIRLINREETHWVVEGPLANLRVLAKSGYRLNDLGRNEPLPREVEITLESIEELAQVTAFHVDVYSVKKREQGITVYAGAFDHQIDQLREAGFSVERISTIEKGDKQ